MRLLTEWFQENLDPNSPDFHIRVMWKSKSFLSEYWNMVNTLSKNPFLTSVEELMWSCQHLGQILLDLKLVQAEDLKVKRPNFTFLQRIARLHGQLLESAGDWSKIQKIFSSVFPVTKKSWWYANVRKQDWSVLQTEKLDSTAPKELMAVPKYRLLPDNCR